MIKLIIIYFFLVSSTLFGQFIGKSPTGKLFDTSTKEVKKISNTGPNEIPLIINIINPIIQDLNEVIHYDEILVIKGEIIGSPTLKSITVNDQKANIYQGNKFFLNLKLDEGINKIIVKAINKEDNISILEFIVNRPVDITGPIINIIEPAVSRGIKIVRKSSVVNVRGFVSDESGIYEVYVNSKKVTLQPNNEFISNIYLNIGNNKIIVNAIDNKLNSTIDTFFVERKEVKKIIIGRYVALCIGINSYEGYWKPLKNAVNDAVGISEILKNYYNFDEIYTIIDKEATRRKILEKLEELSTTLTRDDNLVIFYAGHGQYNKNLEKGYWVPIDSWNNSIAGYISNNDIKTFLGGIPTRHTLLITDACFAGDIFRGARTESIKKDPNDMTKYYSEIIRKPSRIAITSGSLELVSDEGKNGHSVFTYYLLKALKENKNKYLDASQLFDEFKMAVVNNSDQTPQLNVVRDTNDEGGQFVFVRNSIIDSSEE